MMSERRPFAILLFACLTVAAVGLPDVAPAQSSPSELSAEEKKQMLGFLKAGKEAYQKGNFAEAIPFFKKAYELYPNPAFHYRIGLAHERAGHPKEALDYYKRFLKAEPDTSKRGQVEKTIERLEKQIDRRSRATISIESEPGGAKVFIGEESTQVRGTTPMQMKVEPGSKKLVVRKEGFGTVSELVEVEAGSSYNYNYTLPPRSQSGGKATGGIRPLPFVFAGLGLAGVGTSAILMATADCPLSEDKTTDIDSCGRNEYYRHVKLVTATGVTGVASLGTAGILWAVTGFRKPGPESASRGLLPGVDLGVAFSPTGIRLNGQF